MRRTRAGTGNGSIYRPPGRDGKPTQWLWLKYRLPGDLKPRREPTNPRTDDEAEARRQLHVRMGERGTARRRRQLVEDLLVADLLSLYVAECNEHGQPVPPGHVEAWVTELGHERAIEVERDMLDSVCRRWRKAGATWTKGQLERGDGEPLTWEAR